MPQFDIEKITGLSQKEAALKLSAEGYNELPSAGKRSIFAIAFSVAKEPMFMLLMASGIVYFLLGSIQEASMLLAFVLVVMGITLYQERKTERALEALRNLSSPRALVIRDGRQKRIAGREVVLDDILVLSEGDRVPADAVLLISTNLSADESLLTGESVPVRKMAEGKRDKQRPGGDDSPYVFSGTLIVQGYGVAKVLSTGPRTEMGKIGQALQAINVEDTLIQKETKALVAKLAVIGLSICALIVVIYGLTRHNWLEGFLAGITLAMAVLPEEFPVVLMVFLALGAWRISKNQVLTRRVPAIEMLGAATVLCSDKTGTITFNRLSVSEIYAENDFLDVGEDGEALPEKFHELIEFAILASQKEPYDPIEKALKDLGGRTLSGTEHLHGNWSLVRQYPLSKDLLALSHVWKSPGGETYAIASKGAPEAIMDLCHLPEDQVRLISEKIEAMAVAGLRVLGVAKAHFKVEEKIPDIEHEYDFEFVGLVGFKDLIRPTVPGAVKDCYQGGIRVAMITGDYPSTARNIAENIGLRPADAILTGTQLNRLSDAELKERIGSIDIFARVVPEQKLRIVNALKANGEIVAMTGDGVNDAPALKAAHIGIAMGARGTDVARETASLVLLDDDFSSIVKAIKLGRRVFSNLKKAISYIFSVHVPIVGLSLIPVVFKWPLILAPAHIAFLELIIDPTCSVVFEAEPADPQIMDHPPRRLDEPLFSRRTVGLSVLQGSSVLIVLLALFVLVRSWGYNMPDARAVVFTALVIANLSLILINRSRSKTVLEKIHSPNKALWWVIGGTLVLLAAILSVPFLRDLFELGPMSAKDVLISFAAGAFSVFWFELLKLFGLGKKLR